MPGLGRSGGIGVTGCRRDKGPDHAEYRAEHQHCSYSRRHVSRGNRNNHDNHRFTCSIVI
jgi:hypothetical protein